MHPHTQLSTSLVVAVVLWLPSLSATLSGSLDLFGAAVRFAAALTITRLAVAGLNHLYLSYRLSPEEPARPEAATTTD